MSREQTARREAVSRIGQAAGEGIAYGLEVEHDVSAESEADCQRYRGFGGQPLRAGFAFAEKPQRQSVGKIRDDCDGIEDIRRMRTA